ncbi:DUF262 domain-containing HNH endonuclease family protein [Moraxella sp. FZFQ2102]|uniref:GmrSD restriction endonuclease domain-containing protein n=1 Tax=Moraxella sp. FZFQ2102 TaxID=2953752 RepID=UPI00209C45A0|nr:DUF262 domain-containing protein [Moraxella sp. FZFQ2102]USZ14022.1 DUF262 domain-containing HNH endonuclease family protein [Moraxella sp. FZFQ2102]
MSEAVKLLTIEQLLSQEDHYLIPVYQRNYAWGGVEIGQLVQDLYKAFEQDKDKAYYLGTLVVHHRADGRYEVIDGQQRLTTLHILNKCLSKFDGGLTLSEIQWDAEQTNLDFESRPESKAQIDNPAVAIKADSGIADGFVAMWQALINLKNLEDANLKDRELIDQFKEFINKQVKICRTIVPKDTDLNHYFEIMNTRGEQLEKHEIIKAQLMGKLDPKDQKAFAMIWDACSDMSRFAVSGLPTVIRAEFFVDQLPCRLEQDFDLGKFKNLLIDKKAEGLKDKELEERKAETKQDLEAGNLVGKSIIKIIDDPIKNPKDVDNTDDGQYQSVIDFPNFLLHVLKVRETDEEKKEKISLDDKSLLTAFESLKDADAVKRFAMDLLKCRLLFDYYVIKQDNRKANDGTDVKWAILQPKLSNNSIYAKNTFQTDKEESESNEHLVMVQAMFHVSHSSRIYKTWLQDVLAYLWKNRTQTKDKDFDKKFLDELHRLAHDDYYQKQRDKLNYPNVSYFMLNYVDYRLWYEWKQEWKQAGQDENERVKFFEKYAPNQNSSAEELKKAFDKFVFMHRSSIEHCYPRNPEDQSNRKTGDDLIALNQLGNLCLVSHSENSRLSNLLPEAKREKVIARLNSGRSTQSLSQLIMLMHEKWDISAIDSYTDKLEKLDQKIKLNPLLNNK